MRTLFIAILLCCLTVVAVVFAGPVASGAVLLLVPGHSPAKDHDLPDAYQPLHKGHVDLGSGLYVREDEDLVVRGTPPLILRRTYLSDYHTAKQFGVGTTHNGERYLIGDGERFQWASLILSDGARVKFDRVSSGTSFFNALYEDQTNPGEWQGAQLGWAGIGWAMRRRDGSSALFQACGPNTTRVCSIVQERDWDGHTIGYRRDASGRLSRMEAASNRWIAFDYDSQDRITRAFDNTNRAIRYDYDDGGRLVRVTASDGTSHRYTYTNGDQMATIVEPWTTIENTYDADGRVVRQVNRFPDGVEPYIFDFTYHTQGTAVVQADSKESDGTWARYKFSEKRYVISETLGGQDSQPADVAYERDAVSSAVTALTVTCLDRTGQPLAHSRQVRPGGEEWTKWDLLQTYCSRRDRSVR